MTATDMLALILEVELELRGGVRDVTQRGLIGVVALA